MKSKIFRSLAVVLLFTSCDPYEFETYPSPALAGGECEIKNEDSYTSTEKAQSALNAIKVILADASNGGVLKVVREEVYLSSLYKHKKKGNTKDLRWSYQVVFECDNASLHYEKKDFGEYKETEAKTALAKRIADLKVSHPNTYKELSQSVVKYEYDEDCDTCCDSDGNNCGDCNCSTEYHYEYRLRYMLLKPENNIGGRIADWYDGEKALNTILGREKNFTDSLSRVSRLFPADSPLSKKIQKAILIMDALEQQKAE